MSDSVSNFCDGIDEQLEALGGRMEMLKRNIGTTWHSLHEKLLEVRLQHEASQASVLEGRARLAQWAQNQARETEDVIDRWVTNRETDLLAARAEQAEEQARTALMLAQAGIDEAERMILEAIAARMDAEAVAKS